MGLFLFFKCQSTETLNDPKRYKRFYRSAFDVDEASPLFGVFFLRAYHQLSIPFSTILEDIDLSIASHFHSLACIF